MKIKKVKLNDAFLSMPIAHRGYHSETVAENSLKAFELAKSENIAIELDIYMLRDGQFAVFHDSNMKRMTGKDTNFSDISSDSLFDYKLWDNQKIPLLSDVLELISGSVPILIELKPEDNFNKNHIKPLLDILDKYNHQNKIAIQSFNPIIVRAIKKQTDKYPVGILSTCDFKNMSKVKKSILSKLKLFSYSGADFISYDIKYLMNKYVQKYKAKNVPVLTWVVTSSEEYKLAKTYSDNIIFEKSEVLNEFRK